MKVSVSELKNRLSHYLRLVKRGEVRFERRTPCSSELPLAAVDDDPNGFAFVSLGDRLGEAARLEGLTVLP